MGCAASKGFTGAMGASSVAKDPEDFTLDHVSFKKVNVAEYDEWFGKFADPVNELIEFNNDLNGAFSDVMEAAATILGGYKVTAKVGAKSAEYVFVDLLKADGKTRPAPADIAPLLANSDVTAADTALTAAKTALRNACLDASEEPKLLVAQGKLVSEGLTEEVKKFNDSLIAFSKALGPELKAVISVVAPKAFGATTFDVLVEKSILEKPDSVKPTLKPLTVLDVAKTADAKTIITAQIALAEQASCAAAAAQELEEVAFAFKKMRLVVGKPSAKEGAPKGDETIAALNKAVSAANCAIFKLRKACWGVGEKVNMTSALIAVLKNLRASVEQKAKDAHKTVLDVLHFKPSVKVADDGALDFDWGIKLELPGVPEFPDCLPVPSKLVHQEVMKLKDTVKELAAKFPELKQKVEALVEESKETFKEPKAKFEAAGLDSMATMKAMTTLGRNTATVATASSQVLGAFVGSVKRVGDELKRAVEEAEKVKEELLK